MRAAQQSILPLVLLKEEYPKVETPVTLRQYQEYVEKIEKQS